MSALSKMKVGLVAAGLSCLAIGFAGAQEQTEREGEREGAIQARDIDVDRDQSNPSQAIGQPHTAQFRGTQPGAAGQEKVQDFLAACLLSKNKAEIELGQLAQQQAQDPQVKQFAQKLVQDHQQIVQKLQPLASKQRAGADAAGQFDAGRQGTAGQSSRTDSQQDSAVKQLMEIDRQITQRYFDAVREDLQQKQGAEFDKCYMASQIGGHMHMLAALEVIEQQGPDGLRQIAQQSQSTVEQHLNKAKQLMKQLEGSTAGASQAERQSPRTQR